MELRFCLKLQDPSQQISEVICVQLPSLLAEIQQLHHNHTRRYCRNLISWLINEANFLQFLAN